MSDFDDLFKSAKHVYKDYEREKRRHDAQHDREVRQEERHKRQDAYRQGMDEGKDRKDLVNIAYSGTDDQLRNYLDSHQNKFTTQNITAALTATADQDKRDMLFNALDEKDPQAQQLIRAEYNRLKKENSPHANDFLVEHHDAIPEYASEIKKIINKSISDSDPHFKQTQQEENNPKKIEKDGGISETDLLINKFHELNKGGLTAEEKKELFDYDKTLTHAQIGLVTSTRPGSNESTIVNAFVIDDNGKETFIDVNASEKYKPVVAQKENAHTGLEKLSPEQTKALQDKLVKEGYIKPEQANGKWDAAQVDAVRHMLTDANKKAEHVAMGNYTGSHTYDVEAFIKDPTAKTSQMGLRDENGKFGGAQMYDQPMIETLLGTGKGIEWEDPLKDKTLKPEVKVKPNFNIGDHVNNLGFHSNADHKRADGRADVDVSLTKDDKGVTHVFVKAAGEEKAHEVDAKTIGKEILAHNKENAYHIHNDDGKNISFSDMMESLSAPKFPKQGTNKSSGRGA